MLFKENEKISPSGYFKIETITKDGSETFEKSNLIMDKARSNMAELTSGRSDGKPIDTFILGTMGHNPTTNNILEPIEVGTFDYTPVRTALFSEEASAFYYTIKWDVNNPVDIDGNPVTWNGSRLELVATGNKRNQNGTEADAENVKCPLVIDVLDKSVKYTITIPEIAANGDDGVSTVAYTEACLKADTDIFSMRTYPARVKENSVKIVVSWLLLW